MKITKDPNGIQFVPFSLQIETKEEFAALILALNTANSDIPLAAKLSRDFWVELSTEGKRQFKRSDSSDLVSFCKDLVRV